jgi:hypothetical protein
MMIRIEKTKTMRIIVFIAEIICITSLDRLVTIIEISRSRVAFKYTLLDKL